MNLHQKCSVLAFWYDSEVNSGGHTCFFDNYAEVKHRDMIAALKLVGAPEYAAIYEKADNNRTAEYDFKNEDAMFSNCKTDLGDILMNFVLKNKEQLGLLE